MKIDPKLIEQFAQHEADTAIDYDLYGKPITDADVMLMGALAPLVVRIAQRAADHALEEAAKVCDEMENEVVDEIQYTDDCSEKFYASPEDCAARIRALKGTK